MKKLFTSESVTEGHPDKICDQIADGILDAYRKQDKDARVACEVCVATQFVLVMGEVTTKAKVDVESIVRRTIREIGYTKVEYGFDAESCEVMVRLKEQSSDIAVGVDGKVLGAGDQGMVFGFACDETVELMPMPIYLAHKLAKQLSLVRRDGTLPYLRPDGKTQVTVEYEEDQVKRIDTILISTQHEEKVKIDQIKQDLWEQVVKKVVPMELLDEEVKYFVNPTGRFVIGGPAGDTGVTGRKIIVDTYGGYSRHGGGSFSGKDPTKVDRSGAYMARFIAKNIVANGLAKKCEVQISYGIGMVSPISVFVDTFKTGKRSDDEIAEIVKQNFDMTPQGMIKTLNLREISYQGTANYGHMGKLNYPWEKIIPIKK